MRTSAALMVLGAMSLDAQQSHLVVVRGISGDPAYRETFAAWAGGLVEAAERRLGMGPQRVTYLSERADDEGADARSTRIDVERVLGGVARAAGPDDVVFVVLIGHGSGTGPESRFNLPGPDLTAVEFNELLNQFTTQRVVFVNTSAASGDFLPVLSGPNRTVVTATKTGFERNESIFGGFFVRAYTDDVADVDKDDRVSVLEAFTYARREVQRAYDADGRLLTEHAVLDDNADGEGTREPGPDGPDGLQARWAFLGGGAAVVAADGTRDTVLVRLYRDKARIEREIETLRGRKSAMEESVYENALEELLVALTLTNREIRGREGGGEW